METTTKDALLAELLGDVGELQQQIEALPGALKEAITPSLVSLGQITRDARTGIERHGQSQHLALTRAAEAERQSLRQAAKDVLRASAASSTGANRGSNSTTKVSRRSLFGPVLVALGCGLFGAVVGLLGGYVFFGAEQAHAQFGRATIAVWDKLDARAKALIQSAR